MIKKIDVLCCEFSHLTKNIVITLISALFTLEGAEVKQILEA